MNLRESSKLAISSLLSNKFRSFLTMLGIVIGVASIIIIISVGAGAQSLILNQIKSVGSNLIGILPGTSEEDGPPASAMGIVITTLKYGDTVAILDKKNVPHAEAVAPYVQGIGTINWDGNNADATFIGTTAGYINVEDVKVAEGRFINEQEEKEIARVVVLGHGIKKELFGDEDALNERVKIRRETFRVIGILEERGSSGFINQDDYVFIPVSSAQKLLLGINHVSFIRVKVDDSKNIERTMDDVTYLLRERHEIKEDDPSDFTIRSQEQALKALTTVTDVLKFFMASIAALSLVVGGIGIMNIMLISVSERTREIGLRKAIGAKFSHIMNQFLTETIIISLLSGIIGILIGAAISALIAAVARYLDYDWDLVISLFSIFLSVGVSGSIGLIFGIYPARKAAKLNPIEALRYE
ncbi:MAG: ABC transporter permease [bacterium]